MEAKPTNRITIYINPASVRWLKMERINTGKPVSEIADKIIAKAIRERDRKDKAS